MYKKGRANAIVIGEVVRVNATQLKARRDVQEVVKITKGKFEIYSLARNLLFIQFQNLKSSKKSKHRSRSKDRSDYSSSKKTKRSSRSRTRSRSPTHHRHSSSHQNKSSSSGGGGKSLSPDSTATTALIKSAFPNIEKISATLVHSISAHQANVTRTAAAATPATPATKPVIPPNVVLSSFNNNPFKLNNLVKKPPSQAHQLNPNFNPLIPTNLNNYTTTVLAARAAAIAAANSVNLQIMQQANHLKPSSSTTMTMSSSNGVIVTQPLRPQGLTTTIYTNSHNAGVINTVTTTNPPQYNQQEMIAAKSAHLTEAQLNAEKEAEQKRLEEEMRKRRERIEKWRNEKKSKEEAKDNGSSMVTAAAGNDANKKVNNGNGKRIFF
jgi:hypothetical protein